MSGVAPDPLDRIVEEFDVHGTLETRYVLALVEVARAARDIVVWDTKGGFPGNTRDDDQLVDALAAALAQLDRQAQP